MKIYSYELFIILLFIHLLVLSYFDNLFILITLSVISTFRMQTIESARYVELGQLEPGDALKNYTSAYL